MDFVELEATEALRWSWNAWPTTKSDAASVVVPLSIMCTPLMQSSELPIFPYEPLHCTLCNSVLNPYARVYQTRIWSCPFCYRDFLSAHRRIESPRGALLCLQYLGIQNQ
ncbi:unnamed protein product [Linum trigynum]|uniref:Protein transport protein SEC23 n=1 Tax=Linum trigynum TaxID=586398 RepID=A0AAV2GNA5_9ROSI